MIKNFSGAGKDDGASAAPQKSARMYLYAPDEEEIAGVAEKVGLSADLLKLSLDRNALSRVHRNHMTYAIFDIPTVSRSARHQRVKTVPVGIYYNADLFIAVSNTSFAVISDILSDPDAVKTENEELFLRLMFEVAKIYIAQLNHINKETELLEDQMKRRVRNTAIFQLIEYQRSLTAITTSLRGLKRLLTRIRERNFCEDPNELLDDVMVAAEQASEMAEIFNDDLDALMDGFGSITSNSVNDIMKILTALTLILSIPMVIAGLYGMNVRLPFAENDSAFWYVCGISGLLSAGTAIWFYFKKMF